MVVLNAIFEVYTFGKIKFYMSSFINNRICTPRGLVTLVVVAIVATMVGNTITIWYHQMIINDQEQISTTITEHLDTINKAAANAEQAILNQKIGDQLVIENHELIAQNNVLLKEIANNTAS